MTAAELTEWLAYATIEAEAQKKAYEEAKQKAKAESRHPVRR